MTRPIKAIIDLSALRHNHGIARRYAGAAKIWDVIKANAYGHGLLRAARALDATTDGFALNELENAIVLRQASFHQPILLLEGFYAVDELPAVVEHQLTPVLHSLEQVAMLAAAMFSTPMPVYLKLNTGMNRLGLNEDELPQALSMLRACPQVAQVTLMTHFANADEEQGIAGQMVRFKELRRFAPDLPFSLANSAALLRFSESCGGGDDWVRPGIMLYGSSPFPGRQSAAALDLRPVMTLMSELIAIRELVPGDSVGYGSTFTADKPMRVGIAACGYADGYPRHAPTGTPILVSGQRTRTLGRVSMDKLCVDLSAIPQAGIGSPVVLWGDGLAADEVASAAGTISYELFCALAARVPQVEIG